MTDRVRWGFVAAGFVNVVGILLFSRAFSNDYMVELSPIVASRFGLVCIMLWGLAYLAVARIYQAVPLLIAVFALEKAVYVVTWFLWLGDHGREMGSIWERDPLTAIFYANYGLNDLLFGVFFAWVAITTLKPSPTRSGPSLP